MLNISSQDVEILILAASHVAIPSPAITIHELYMREVQLHNWGRLDPLCTMEGLLCYSGRLSWGCPILDSQLGNGILVPGVTELSGVSAAGKTQLCLQLSLVVQLAKGQGGLNGGKII